MNDKKIIPIANHRPKSIEFAPTDENGKREREIQLLINILVPDPEYQPFFLSDESIIDDLGLEEDEIRKKLSFYFGGVFSLSLDVYLWQLIDFIKAAYPGWPDDWS